MYPRQLHDPTLIPMQLGCILFSEATVNWCFAHNSGREKASFAVLRWPGRKKRVNGNRELKRAATYTLVEPVAES